MNTGINRIRLEFKVIFPQVKKRGVKYVLIESDWNLKERKDIRLFFQNAVLIESDWNLKSNSNERNLFTDIGINRIRLEFKVLF